MRPDPLTREQRNALRNINKAKAIERNARAHKVLVLQAAELVIATAVRRIHNDAR